MKDTKIRWADQTWNPMTGCTKVSPGCDHCYAEAIATKFSGTAFPRGFEPTFKPTRVGDPRNWREPLRVFVNSMSDVHHPSFSVTEVDAIYDVMAEVDRHDYLILTKRPARMAAHLRGWLRRRGLAAVPDHIWCGTSIEADRFAFRANYLRQIPVAVRFISAEPLLEALPSLDLSGLSWVIVGGESGPGYRPMDHEWAADLRDRCLDAGVAYFFKQSAAPRTEMGIELEGVRWEQWPRPHPTQRVSAST